MKISIAEQTEAFLNFILLGAVGGAAYGIFSALRILNNGRKFLSALLDILYFFLLAVCSFLLFLVESDGKLRGYLYIGEGIGWLLWQLTAGRIWERGLTRLFRFVRQQYRHFCKGCRQKKQEIKKNILKKRKIPEK